MGNKQTLKITSIGQNEETDSKSKEGVAEDSINAAGFGKFNYKVTILCSLIYINAAFSILSTGFIIPAAACDFKMTTIDKGRIITAPILGSCFGPFVWGFLADVKGRKFSLIIALFLQGNCELLMSIVPNYWGFLVLKFFSGFGVIGQLSLLFTYVGEFQPTNYRKKILSLMDLALIVGMVLVPLLGWSIIPLTFHYRNSFFLFRSWNLFIFLCSIPAEIIGLWLIFFPETPKYLAETGRNIELFNVLVKVYTENTSKSPESYFKILSECKNPLTQSLALNYVKKKEFDEEIDFKNDVRLKSILSDFKNQAKAIRAAPYLSKTILACLIAFTITLAYYSFLLWFPEVFQRLAQFQYKFPNETATICSISDRMYSRSVNLSVEQIDPFGCDVPIDTSVYINSLWQAVACIPSSIILVTFIDKVGFKNFLVAATLAAFFTTLGMFFAKTKLQIMILTCFFESMTSICMSVIFCFVVVIFPTNFRVFAGALAIFFSRVGSLCGNILFSYLIDNHCVPLIYIIALHLLLGAIFCLMVKEQKYV